MMGTATTRGRPDELSYPTTTSSGGEVPSISAIITWDITSSLEEPNRLSAEFLPRTSVSSEIVQRFSEACPPVVQPAGPQERLGCHNSMFTPVEPSTATRISCMPLPSASTTAGAARGYRPRPPQGAARAARAARAAARPAAQRRRRSFRAAARPPVLRGVSLRVRSGLFSV